MLIKKGMKVRVISGAHKGSEGKVLFTSPKKQRIIVEGVNFIKKSTRPSQENPNGGIVEKEAAMNLSNVAIWNPKQKKADRISFQTDGDKKLRVYSSDKKEIKS